MIHMANIANKKEQATTIADLYVKAVAHFNATRFTDADHLCNIVLNTAPDHVDTLNLSGVIAQKLNRWELAVQRFKQALTIQGNLAVLHYNLAISLYFSGRAAEAIKAVENAIALDAGNQQYLEFKKKLSDQPHKGVGNDAETFLQKAVEMHLAGRLDAAVQLYQSGLTLATGNTSALVNCALALYGLGRYDESADYCRRAIAINPGMAEAYFNLGNALRELGGFSEALAAYDRAVSIKPEYGEAWSNRGITLLAAGMAEDAVTSFQRAITLLPELTEAHCGLGNAMKKLGRLDDAVSCQKRAIAINPEYADAYNNLGNILKDLGRLDEAQAFLEKALEQKPNSPTILTNLGAVHKAQWKLDEAVACYQKALAIKPDCVDTYGNLANALKEQSRPTEAIAALEQGIEIKSDLGLMARKAMVQAKIHDSSHDIMAFRQRMEREFIKMLDEPVSDSDPYSSVADTNFLSAYHGLNDRQLQALIAAVFKQKFSLLSWSPPVRQTAVKTVIRIGFVSSFLRDHTIGHLNKGVIEHLDRNRFEVFIFRPQKQPDEYSSQIDAVADKVVNFAQDIVQARQAIAAEEVDLLFYTDIGMCPFTYFLAFHRLAPVQCVTWGHPVTTGISTIDYFISSESLEIDTAQEHYCEELFLSKRLPCFHQWPKISEKPAQRQDFGLPQEGNIYLCPQSLFKIHPDFDAAIMGILAGDADGWVVLLDGQHSNWSDILKRRFKRSGNDLADRIVFIPRIGSRDFISLLQLADVIIDPFNFSGGKTSAEALAVGAPIVTMPGPYMCSRVTAACYGLMGVTDLVTSDLDSYVATALRLTADAAWKQTVVAKIRANVHLIIEDMQAVREFERFFTMAVARAGRGVDVGVNK